LWSGDGEDLGHGTDGQALVIGSSGPAGPVGFAAITAMVAIRRAQSGRRTWRVVLALCDCLVDRSG
jgi:hypothetical protein